MFTPEEEDSLPDYQSLAAQNIETVFEVGIEQIAFVRGENNGTTFSLMVNAYARLVDISAEETIWADDQIVYLSRPADILDWTAVGQNRLEAELESGLNELAQDIHRRAIVRR